jgi:hypothetical protein
MVFSLNRPSAMMCSMERGYPARLPDSAGVMPALPWSANLLGATMACPPCLRAPVGVLQLCAVLALCLVFSASAHAQQPPVRMPQGNASWVVDIKPLVKADIENEDPMDEDSMVASDAGDAGLAVLKSIRVTQAGDLRRDELRWSDGRSTDLWFMGGKWVAELRTGDIAALEIFGEFRPFRDWEIFSAAQLGRFTRGAVVSEAKFKGKPAILYATKLRRQQIPAGMMDGEDSSPEEYAARLWVDPATRLPLAIDNGELLYRFRFSNAPPEEIRPPEKFIAELKRYLRRSSVPKPQERPRAQ